MTRTFKIKKSDMPDLSQMMLATIKALKVIGGSLARDALPSIHKCGKRAVSD